jgi:hypothetical protein
VLFCFGLSIAPAEEKVAIPFDFESKFDRGRYGQIVGEMVWKKLAEKKRFVVPESMLDVRDVCDRLHFHPGPQTEITAVGKIVRDEFGGHIGIWGGVERVPPNETDVYDLWIKVVDFSNPEPAVIYDGKHRTLAVSEIPHVYVKAMLMKLHGERPAEPPAADRKAEERWKTGPNLVVNGDFEKGDKRPTGWDPLPQYVSIVADKTGRRTKMEFPEEVAATTGVLYYSDYFPIEEGATYRFSCRYRTTGSAVKVFIKCYDEFAGESGTRKAAAQRREVYRSQQNLKGPANQWNTHVEDFTPQHARFTPKWGRVMLYAYWPQGAVEWDDVVVKQIKQAK